MLFSLFLLHFQETLSNLVSGTSLDKTVITQTKTLVI